MSSERFLPSLKSILWHSVLPPPHLGFGTVREETESAHSETGVLVLWGAAVRAAVNVYVMRGITHAVLEMPSLAFFHCWPEC